MWRGHDELEHRAFGRIQIQVAVGENVRFYSLEDAKLSAKLRIQLIDLLMLRRGVGHADSACDWKTVRMIGDAEAGVSQVKARARKSGDRLPPIAPRRVHLKIPAVVSACDHVFSERRRERLLHGEVTQIRASEL